MPESRLDKVCRLCIGSGILHEKIMKICPICFVEHNRSGNACSKKCSGIKCIQTMIKNGMYELRKQKISKTMIDIFNNDNKKSRILEKRFNSLYNNYGEIGYSHPDILRKQYESKLKNNTLPASKNVVDKMFETKKKNGTLPNSPEIIKKQLNTFYSHDENFIKDVVTRRHETYKRNGTHTKSKPADLFFSIFGDSLNLIREFQITNRKCWFIDFYSEKYKLYIQFDGNYWHSVNKTNEEIQEILSNHEKYKRIVGHIYNDRQQNKYFEDKGLKFLRIAEKSFLDYVKNERPQIKNPLKSGKLHLVVDNPELALITILKLAFHKSNATTIQNILNESDKSNLGGMSRVDLKEDRNRGVLVNTENLLR